MPELSEPAIQANTVMAPLPLWTGSVSRDALQGLETLVDLFGQTCETLNRSVLSVEAALNALPITEEAWIPLPGARLPADPAEAPRGVQAEAPSGVQEVSEQRVFNGVAVTIMKLGPSLFPSAPHRPATSEFQLGYGRLDDRWGLLIATGQAVGSNTDATDTPSASSDRKSLMRAPLEVKLRGIREMASLLALLESRRPVGATGGGTGGEFPQKPDEPSPQWPRPIS